MHGQHGLTESLVAAFLMLYQFTVANFSNLLRCVLHKSLSIPKANIGYYMKKILSTMLILQVKVIFDFLKNGFQEISSSLDLSFNDDSVAEEKIPFLAHLAQTLKENTFFPYEPPVGSKRFRSLIAGFMKTYHHTPLTANVSRKHCFIIT